MPKTIRFPSLRSAVQAQSRASGMVVEPAATGSVNCDEHLRMRPELRPGARSLTGHRAVPLHSLTGDCGDTFEVVVAVQEGQSLEFRGGGNDEVNSSRTTVLTALGQQLLNLPGAAGAPAHMVRAEAHRWGTWGARRADRQARGGRAGSNPGAQGAGRATGRTCRPPRPDCACLSRHLPRRDLPMSGLPPPRREVRVAPGRPAVLCRRRVSGLHLEDANRNTSSRRCPRGRLGVRRQRDPESWPDRCGPRRVTANVEGPRSKLRGPSTYCPVRAMAEDTRFELVRGCPQHAFQACALGH